MRGKRKINENSEPRRASRNKEELSNHVKSENSKKLCHLCLCKSENSKPLFEESTKTVLENIRNMFQIEPIQDDAAPDQICAHCVEKMDDFIAFRQMVVDNHQKLRLEVEEAKQVDETSDVFEPCVEMDDEEIEKEEEPPKLPKKRKKRNFGSNPSRKWTPADKDDDNDVLLRNYFNFECPQCSQEFPRFRTLRHHARVEHKLRDFAIACYRSDCKDTFKQRYELLAHLKKHGIVLKTPERRFECGACNKKFQFQSVLKNHLTNSNCATAPIPSAMYECDLCAALYRQKGPLKRHFELNHQFVIVDRPANAKHQCSQCSKTFPSQVSHLRHVRIIHDRAEEVICHICAKIFAQKAALKFHYNSVHAPTPKVTCPVCGKALANRSVLAGHLRRSHRQQPMTCEICSKVLRNRDSWLRHVKHIHETPKFVCPECNKGFHKKMKLTEHMTTHAIGDALYKCELCDKTFNFSSSKSLHKKTQHPVEWLQSRDETYNWTNHQRAQGWRTTSL